MLASSGDTIQENYKFMTELGISPKKIAFFPTKGS